jgi:hypothetical protein
LTISVAIFVIVATRVTVARAAGGSGYQNPEALALGLDGPSHVLTFRDPDFARDRLWIEAGQRRLFGFDDLVSNGAELGVCVGGLGFVISASFMSSPIGVESRYLTSVMYLGSRRIRFTAGLGADVVALGGFERTVAVFAAASAVVDLSDALRLVSTIDGVRITGEENPGADISASVVVFPRASASALLGVGMTRHGAPGAGFGARIRFSRVVSAAVGYDEGAGMLKGSFSVCIRSVGVHAGASIHSVLGVSKAVSISWRR